MEAFPLPRAPKTSRMFIVYIAWKPNFVIVPFYWRPPDEIVQLAWKDRPAFRIEAMTKGRETRKQRQCRGSKPAETSEKHHERSRIIEKSEKHDDNLTGALEFEENESTATLILGGLNEKLALELV